MQRTDRDFLDQMAESLNAKVAWETDDSLHLNAYRFASLIDDHLIEMA